MTILNWPMPIVLFWLFLLGAALGSFLNVCIYRIPKHERFADQLRGLTHPPSSCPRCRNVIPPFDNIPILGWLMLGGRCRYCQCRISPRYPSIELFNGLLLVAVYWLEVPYGFSATVADSCLYAVNGPQNLSLMSDASMLNWRVAYHFILIEALVVATFIDLDLRIIPDGSTLPAMFVGLTAGGILGQLYIVPVWFADPRIRRELHLFLPESLHWMAFEFDGAAWAAGYPHLHGFAVSLAGFVVGGGIIWIVRFIGFRVLRQEAMGFGDVILMAMIGSFIGWQPVIAVFFIAPLLALIVVGVSWLSRRQRMIPYGPYLSAATLVVILGWSHVGPIIERVFSMGPIILFMAAAMIVSFWLSLYALQLVKRMFGIPLYPPDEWIEEWTSADHLHHFAGETVDDQQGLWRHERWGGCDSGRGMSYDARWRRGSR